MALVVGFLGAAEVDEDTRTVVVVATVEFAGCAMVGLVVLMETLAAESCFSGAEFGRTSLKKKTIPARKIRIAITLKKIALVIARAYMIREKMKRRLKSVRLRSLLAGLV